MPAAAWTGTIATTQYSAQSAGNLGQWLSAHGGVAILAVSDDLIAALERSSRVPPSGGRSMTHGILLHKLSRSSRSAWLPSLASAGPID